jgi:hypothetical protein
MGAEGLWLPPSSLREASILDLGGSAGFRRIPPLSPDTDLIESDAELITRLQRGDRDAFTVLVRRWEGPLVRIAYRITGQMAEAEDIRQRVFLKRDVDEDLRELFRASAPSARRVDVDALFSGAQAWQPSCRRLAWSRLTGRSRDLFHRTANRVPRRRTKLVTMKIAAAALATAGGMFYFAVVPSTEATAFAEVESREGDRGLPPHLRREVRRHLPKAA